MYEKELDFAIKLSKEAGKIQMKHFGKVHDVKSKGKEGLLTIADIESDKLIREMIKKEYPDHAILTEESGGKTDLNFVWIVDPLDGTTNFSNSIPLFSVSIALLHNGKPVLGVVYAPYLNELFYNKGNVVFMNGNKVDSSKRNSLDNSVIYFGFNSYDTKKAKEGVEIFNIITKAEGVSLRKLSCASLCLAYVAAGRGDAYIDLHMKPWDMAAAGLFVEKVGRITDIKGGEWNPFSKGAIASNRRIHKEVLRILNTVK